MKCANKSNESTATAQNIMSSTREENGETSSNYDLCINTTNTEIKKIVPRIAKLFCLKLETGRPRSLDKINSAQFEF